MINNGNKIFRPKVLLSAYACEPKKSSEQGVGWNWALHLSHYCDVTVFTRKNNQQAIEAECLQNPKLQNIQWHYHDLGLFWRCLKRMLKCHRLYYALWQKMLEVHLRRHIEIERYDIIHHLTFASYRYFTAISGLTSLTIWGPVGGAESTPWSLLGWHNPISLIHEILRNLQTSRSRSLHSAAQYSKVLASTCETRDLLLENCVPSEVFPTIGLDECQLKRFSRSELPQTAHRLLYVGNLQFLKGVQYAIRALPLMPEDAVLTIAGSGPHEKTLKALTTRLGLHDRVNFLGQISHHDLPEIYHVHDVFLFPSLHDSGGIALLEAMAASMPSISLCCGGPRVIVDATCGMQIVPTTEREIIEGIASAVRLYFKNRDLLKQHGTAARSRVVEQFSWDVKAKKMLNIYKRLISDASGPANRMGTS